MRSNRFLAAAAVAIGAAACSDPQDDLRTVAALDTAYQAAVERNDARTMETILHEEMILVLGDGRVLARRDLLEAALKQKITYQHQVEDEGTQSVRLFGRDTAIVTARLWVKGVRADGGPIDVRLWFSDTYVRTASGWRYAFGQASSPLPPPGD